MKILIVEDEPALLEVMRRSLESERYVVEYATSCAMAKEKISMYGYDCVLLDIMLGDGNGLDLLRMLKESQRTERVIITSAKDSLDDKVLGLDLGADDYLPKPFHLSELSARIKSVLRRNEFVVQKWIELGNVKLFPETFQVTVDDKEIDLLRKEYDILYFFISRPGRVVQKEVLAEWVWGDHIDQVDNYDFMYAQIKNLRKKLTLSGANVEIKAVYGFGYKMTVEQ